MLSFEIRQRVGGSRWFPDEPTNRITEPAISIFHHIYISVYRYAFGLCDYYIISFSDEIDINYGMCEFVL